MSAVLKSDKLRQLRVLIVEDNAGDRFLYRQMLEESDPATDYTFSVAASGQAALEQIQEGNLDAVLLDYLLPDMVGLEMIKAMGAEPASSRLPIVMLTGFGDEATAVNALQAGAHGYIAKRDLNGEKLRRAIDHAIKTHANQLSLEKSRQEMVARNQELQNKYQQVESFYQRILGKLKKPAFDLRDHISELTVEETHAVNGNLRSQLLKLRLESERLVTTLKNLMDKPGLDLGQLLISTRPESIVELLSATVNNFRTLADAKNIRLSVKVQPGLPDLPMDRYRIEQVLVNLLDNAIKFTPPQGKISLTVDWRMGPPENVTVRVIDSGPGLEPERLPHLFEPNNHQLPGNSETCHGIGLGLKVCREIIHSHQGTISAGNLPEGGACLTFTLPLETRNASSAEIWEKFPRKNNSAQWGLRA